jgi:transposase
LLADRSDDAEARVLAPLREADTEADIPPKRNRKAPRDDDRDRYAARHLIENLFCRLKQFRGIATRYDKTKRYFPAAVYLAATAITRP